jgi:hypothetical protein
MVPEAAPVTSPGRYDEGRAITVLAGEALVALGAGMGTETRHDLPLPEPIGPQGDPPPAPPEPDTVRTFIEQEVDNLSDLAWRAYLLRTETTVRREQPDYDGG